MTLDMMQHHKHCCGFLKIIIIGCMQVCWCNTLKQPGSMMKPLGLARPWAMADAASRQPVTVQCMMQACL